MEPMETKVVCGVTLRKDPVREACFAVADTDAEMVSWPDMEPRSRRERLHRHMNNEMTSVEVAAQCLVDFPDAPWDLRMELARQTWDESRHVMGLYRRLKELGGYKGEFPVANFEWSVTCMLDSLVGRLTLQNRTFEAGTMDLMAFLPRAWREAGDDVTAELLEGIAADEIHHVRFANHWIRQLTVEDRRQLFKVAYAVKFLDAAQKAFSPEAGATNLAGVLDRGRFAVGPDQCRRPAACRLHRGRNHGDPQAGRHAVDRFRARGAHLTMSGTPDTPLRDPRFTVAERWQDCANLEDGHPEKTSEFLHRQMNEEIEATECSARSITDFPDAPWEIRMFLARQCADEARHAMMFRRLFQKRGVRMGQYPVMNFQYPIICAIPTLVGRLTVQNRTFEAEGIDAIEFGIEQSRREGDDELVDLFEGQFADEILHVRFANEFIRATIESEPRQALRVASSLTMAQKEFGKVFGDDGSAVTKYTISEQGRTRGRFQTRGSRPRRQAGRAAARPGDVRGQLTFNGR